MQDFMAQMRSAIKEQLATEMSQIRDVTTCMHSPKQRSLAWLVHPPAPLLSLFAVSGDHPNVHPSKARGWDSCWNPWLHMP